MSRNYTKRDLRILYTQSLNLCAFPGCNKQLVYPENSDDDAVNLSDIAHIVADSRQGPRGHSSLSDEERNSHTNLLLLCQEHHRVVDTQKHTYSVPVLQQMKRDHLARVQRLTGNHEPAASPLVDEDVPSTVLSVTHLPSRVYSAPCHCGDDEAEVKRSIIYPPRERDRLFPFILRDGQLFTFDNLHRSNNAFRRVVDTRAAGEIPSEIFWADDEGHRRFVNLLNRTLFKYMSLLGVRYDPDHHRFYYASTTRGERRTVRYKPLNVSESSRDVAWRPQRRDSGELKNFWWHLAAGLRFEHVAARQWCLTVRPERHVTTDGEQPLPPDKVGPKVTRLKAKMYNDKYLAEIQFWRDVLCGGKRTFVIKVGTQSIICDSTLLTFGVRWPGVPDDTISYKNQEYVDDLFNLGDVEAALRGDVVDDEDEEDDYDED